MMGAWCIAGSSQFNQWRASNMRAIKIDATNNTLTIVDVDAEHVLRDIYKHGGFSTMERMGNIGTADVWGDEEGRLKGDTRAFMLHGMWVCGSGVVLGGDERTGESMSTYLTLDEVQAHVEWLPMGKVLHTEW